MFCTWDIWTKTRRRVFPTILVFPKPDYALSFSRRSNVEERDTLFRQKLHENGKEMLRPSTFWKETKESRKRIDAVTESLRSISSSLWSGRQQPWGWRRVRNFNVYTVRESWTGLWQPFKSVSKMPYLSVQLMSWEIRSRLRRSASWVTGRLSGLPSKPSWKKI